MPTGASSEIPDASPFITPSKSHAEAKIDASDADGSSSEEVGGVGAVRPDPPKDFPQGKAHRVADAKIKRDRKKKAELIREEKRDILTRSSR